MKQRSPIELFHEEVVSNIEQLGKSKKLKETAFRFLEDAGKLKYSYNFSWMGRPVIQVPQDIVAMQEIIWNVKPDLIIETGIAHGGSLIFYASMLELLGRGIVVGIDIDIREHNRKEIERHPMSKRIEMIQGSSVDAAVLRKVRSIAKKYKKVLVCLDAFHTHDHVLRELELYSPLVSRGSYIVAFDTLVEYMKHYFFNTNRPWGKGNNPATAVRAFLRKNKNFVIDRDIENKILITHAPGGYLRRIK